MAVTSYGSISQRTAAWAANEMLTHAEPILVLSKFGLSKPLPKNKADNIKFRRPIPFGAATTPLTEGVTPTAQQLNYEDVPVTIAQYGGVVEITDQVADLSEDPVLKDASMLSGEQAAETVEMLTWGVLKGGTNITYGTSGSVARTTVNTAITIGNIRSVVRGLDAQRARPLTSMLSGSTDYATKPIEGGYVAFGHTDLAHDLRQLGTSFTPVAEYGSRQPLCPQEIGSVENVRFILSPLLAPFLAGGSVTLNGMKSVGGVNVDIYPVIFVSKDSYGLVALKGANAITPKVIDTDTPTKDDPLGQRGYVSWKTYFAAVRLNENWVARLEVGVTDL